MQEHAGELLTLLWSIIAILAGLIVWGIKLWTVDLKEWKKQQQDQHEAVLEKIEDLRVTSDDKVDRLGAELRTSFASLNTRLAHVEGELASRRGKHE